MSNRYQSSDSGLYGSQRSFGYSSHMSPSNDHSSDIPLDQLDQYTGQTSNSPTLASPPFMNAYRNNGVVNFSRNHNNDNPSRGGGTGRIYSDNRAVSSASIDAHTGPEAGLGIATGAGSAYSLNSNYRENADRAFLTPHYQNDSSVAFGDEELTYHDRRTKGLPPVPFSEDKGFENHGYQYSNNHMEQPDFFNDNTSGLQSDREPLTNVNASTPRQHNFLGRFFLGDNNGIGGPKQRLPWLVWTLSTIQIAVFIAELAKMGIYTGSPIATQPSFNPMVGPSSYVLINMGARFTPCMHPIAGITDDPTLSFPCPNSTTVDTNVCSLSELCGMIPLGTDSSGVLDPRQWWRFITPIFIHAGFVHIIFNLLLQLKLGADLERDIGIVRFFIVYMASGISGFVLGGNFTPDGIASSGASGSLFGIIALDLLDLIFNWETYKHPVRVLMIHVVEIIVSFVLGLLPGLDNFSHIGGFVMGILLGIVLLRSPLKIRDPEGLIMKGLTPTDHANDKSFSFRGIFGGASDFSSSPQNMRDRSKRWYIWGTIRLAALALAIIYFALLITNFEKGGGSCSWCKYLSCLPVYDWCDSGYITTTTT